MYKANSFKKIAITGITASILLSSIAVTAKDRKAEPELEDTTYIAIPMHKFKMLTEEPKKPNQMFYTYQNGKLAECTANIPNKNNPNKRRQRFKNLPRTNDKGKYETVLLTIEQYKDLLKKQFEQKLNKMNFKDCPDNNIVETELNGKKVKVIQIEPKFRHFEKRRQLPQNTFTMMRQANPQDFIQRKSFSGRQPQMPNRQLVFQHKRMAMPNNMQSMGNMQQQFDCTIMNPQQLETQQGIILPNMNF